MVGFEDSDPITCMKCGTLGAEVMVASSEGRDLSLWGAHTHATLQAPVPQKDYTKT